MMTTCLKTCILFAAPLLAASQTPDLIRQATISGSGGTSGKCTIEVRVDIAAEVDIYGDSARMRTLGGQQSVWNRFVCSGPLPYSMSDFRFRGIDGRGSVRLLRDPRSNNSMAVVRIEDPRAGAEGYTFDIEWSGGSGGAPTGGFATATTQGTFGTPGGTMGRDSRRAQGRIRSASLTPERAVDLCRTEMQARAERDYNLRNINITAAAMDSVQGRSDWVTGSFTAGSGGFRRSSTTYRFNCQLDYAARQIRSLEVIGPDGGVVQPSTASSVSGWGTPAGTTTEANQTSLIRACQDAVVARANRDGYQSVNFTSTAVDPRRADWITGVITGVRGPLTDTFDFTCSMEVRSNQVTNLQMNRR
jgi:hypothetical protein